MVSLKRISISLTFPDKRKQNNFCAFAEFIATKYLSNIGKYDIENTPLLQMSYSLDTDFTQHCKIGHSATRVGIVEKIFDLGYFFKLDNEDKQRQLLLEDIHSRMIFFANVYNLPT